MRAGYSPSEDFSYGVTLGRYQGDASTNHWAADVTYTSVSYTHLCYGKCRGDINL